MSKKLTPELLRSLILNEKSRMDETLETGNNDTEKTKAKEVDAPDYANTIVKDVDWMKQLQIKEADLKKDLKRIQEAKKKLRARIMKNIDGE
jgi:hypothetical protein